ncbi:phage regulatory CII family protein [Oceanobacter kriegii]|uniref:phage regulatory CII family protein n=1 Tax=Oceanobacter kriegii TaxID=64972 RepID=UPI000A05D554|nr:phage regulatory CII family protein [Oceanobacter kriegii]
MSRRTRTSHGGIHTPELACYHATHDFSGGLMTIANRMAITPDTLRKKLDPAQQTHKVSLAEAMQILKITADHRILDSICASVGVNWFAPSDVPDCPADLDVLHTGNNLIRSASELISELERSLENGDIDADERARIDLRLMNLAKAGHAIDQTAARFETTS